MQMTNSVGQRFRLLPQGAFVMGDPEPELFMRDRPRARSVTLTESFWLAETVVTHSQWQAVMGTTPWRDGVEDFATEGPNHPATFISLDDASDFCLRLSELPALEQ